MNNLKSARIVPSKYNSRKMAVEEFIDKTITTFEKHIESENGLQNMKPYNEQSKRKSIDEKFNFEQSLIYSR